MTGSGKINAVILFRALLLIIYCAFFLNIILSGSVAKYVHPRYNIFLIISCAVSAVIITVMLLSVKSHSHAKISAGRIILLILPLLFAFTTRNMDTNYSDNFSSAGGASKYPDTNKEMPAEMLPDFILDAREKDSINMVEKHFVPIIDDIYNNPSVYQGKSISVSGIVLKRKYADNKEEFAVARMMMICCAADVQPAGFICRYKDATSIAANVWYKISGVIEIINLEKSDIPVIKVMEAVKTVKPANQYVYPF
ncbi:MAG: TIGR03943 family protein [Spirochaetota bacterium]